MEKIRKEKYFVKHWVSALVVGVLICLIGVVGLNSLSVEQYPDIASAGGCLGQLHRCRCLFYHEIGHHAYRRAGERRGGHDVHLFVGLLQW